MKTARLALALVAALGCALLAATPATASEATASTAPLTLKVASVAVGGKAGPLAIEVRVGVHAKLAIWVNGRRLSSPFEFAGRRSQTIRLRAADGLRPGPNRVLIRARRGHQVFVANRVVPVPEWVLHADAGADTGTTVRRPARLGTKPARHHARAGLAHRWRIVSRPKGAKVSLRRRNAPRPLLHARTPGTYVFEVEVRSSHADRPAYDRITVPVSPHDPPIGVPINTIDPKTGGISVAGTTYGPGPGIAYVVLERTTRTPVESGNVGTGAAEIAKLAKIAADHEDEGTKHLDKYLEYLMIVSGRAGIPAAQQDAFAGLLKTIGVATPTPEAWSSLAQGQEFTAMGIPGAGSGAGTVRIPGVHADRVSGAIAGYLQKNQAVNAKGDLLYDFVSPEHPRFDTRAAGSGERENRIVVGGATYGGTLPAGVSAGLHVVVLESLTLRPLDNLVLRTNGGNADRVWQRETAEALRRAVERPGGPTVLVQTIGKPRAAGPEWGGVVHTLGWLGANRLLVNALDGSTEYSLVARLGSPLTAADASTAYDHGPYGAPSYPPARLVGTLARTRTSTFEPNVSGTPNADNPSAALNLGLIEVAYQAPQAWPQLAPGKPAAEVAAAQTYICESLNFCQRTDSCAEVRSCYWEKYESNWDAIYTSIVDLGYPRQGASFSSETFGLVRDQLKLEIKAVANVQRYFERLAAPFRASAGESYVDLQAISQKIWSAMQQPAPSNATSWVLGLIGKVAALGTFAGPPTSAIAAGTSAAFGLASYLSNKQGQPILGGVIKTKTTVLGSELYERVRLATDQIAALGMLVVSDYGKLTEAYRHVDSDWSLPSGPQAQVAVGNIRAGAARWFYESLIPAAFPYLIQANGGNARSLDCRLGSRAAWPNQPDTFQMGATVGYDGNGNPIRAIHFFTSGIGGGSSPPAAIGDELFRPRTGASPGLAIEKLSFFTPRVFGGRIAHAVHASDGCQVGWLPGKF